MKKNYFYVFKDRKKIIKSLLIMKLWIFLSLFCIGNIGASNVFSQNISLKFTEVKLNEVFQSIQNQTGYQFLYSNEVIDKIAKVNIEISDASIDEVLAECLKGTGLDFEVNGDKIILVMEDEKEALSQTSILIKGIVTDKDGVPLPGATIVIEGTYTGTTTAIDGSFSIKIPDNKASLKFSFMGYETQIIAVNDKTELSIILKESETTLGEVVVTGMFTKRKETYTGAVTTITEKQLKMYGNGDLITTIRNIDPAFNIVESNKYGSDPNRLPEIKIRGTSSLPKNIKELEDGVQVALNTPLIILDGFEITLEKMRDLNNDEVKSITILKDASATAIYGSKGANGIVVIETKEPKQGKLQFTYNSNIDFEIPDLTSYNLLNAKEKLELEKDLGRYGHPSIKGYKAFGNDPDKMLSLKKSYNELLKSVKKGVNTDWMSKPLRIGVGQRHSLRIEGGDKSFRYSAALFYNRITGVMKGSGRTNFSGTIRISYRHNNLTITNSLSVNSSNSEQTSYGNFSDYVKLNPYWTPYDEKGRIIKILDKSTDLWERKKLFPTNPLYNATLNILNTNGNINVNNNLSVDVLIAKGFTVRGRLGFSQSTGNANEFLPPQHTSFVGKNVKERGTYVYTTNKDQNYSCDLTLSYSKLFKDKHMIYAGLNYNLSEFKNESFSFDAEGFSHQNMDFMPMALRYKGKKPSGFDGKTRNIGLTFNANYSFDDRYFVDISYRLDGSSQFGANKRFSPFWSVGMGWNIYNESFFNKNSIINSLKITATYGTSGNLNFSPYQALLTFSYKPEDRYLNWAGASMKGLANKDLTWQTTDQFNLGINASLFKDKLNFYANLYYKKTCDLISMMDLPESKGFDNYTHNSGTLDNKGVEISLGVILFSGKKSSCYISASLAYNKNTILQLSENFKKQIENKLEDSKNTNQLFNALREGRSSNALFIVKSIGIDPISGNEVFKEYVKDEDGKILTNEKGEKMWRPSFDRTFAGVEYVGVRQSPFNGSINTHFNYGRFDLSLAFGFNWGAKVYNETLAYKVENSDNNYNVDKRVKYERWEKIGDHAAFKKINAYDGNTLGKSYPSSRLVQNKMEFLCQNINLSYKIENNDWILKNMGLKVLSFSFNMSDIFYISSIKRERGTFYPFSHKALFTIRARF
jgi:TonB-linked SusC/RagA family outer membrane protein